MAPECADAASVPGKNQGKELMGLRALGEWEVAERGRERREKREKGKVMLLSEKVEGS